MYCYIIVVHHQFGSIFGESSDLLSHMLDYCKEHTPFITRAVLLILLHCDWSASTVFKCSTLQMDLKAAQWCIIFHLLYKWCECLVISIFHAVRPLIRRNLNVGIFSESILTDSSYPVSSQPWSSYQDETLFFRSQIKVRFFVHVRYLFFYARRGLGTFLIWMNKTGRNEKSQNSWQ